MNERYVLELAIDEVDRDALVRAGWIPVVAKPAGNGAPNVAWLALEPVRSTIAWDEGSYGIYASETPVRPGTVLRVTAQVDDASEGMTYPYSGTAFEAPEAVPGVPPGHFDVRNESASRLTFGLLQAATVNGQRCLTALNAIVLPPQFTADFAAARRLYVWTGPRVAAGTVIAAPDSATIIPFDGEHRTKRYRFDRSAGAFVSAVGDVPQPPGRRSVSDE